MGLARYFPSGAFTVRSEKYTYRSLCRSSGERERSRTITIFRRSAGTSVDLSTLPKEAGPGLPEAIPWWRDLPWTLVAGTIVLALLALEWILYQRGWI